MGRVKKNSEDGYHSAFATRLRELLESAEVSQAKVAEYVGVTRQAISSYSLGSSLPDIEKFIMIADFFEVSTEYLLGRTEIKKADATKQAVAEYLNLSEEAIDAIHLLKYGHFEPSITNDYKISGTKEPLDEMFSDWIECVNLSKMLSDLYRASVVYMEYIESGKHAEKYKLEAEDKQAVWALRDKGYIVLSLSQQLDFYTQSATSEFQKSIEILTDEITKIVAEENGSDD